PTGKPLLALSGHRGRTLQRAGTRSTCTCRLVGAPAARLKTRQPRLGASESLGFGCAQARRREPAAGTQLALPLVRPAHWIGFLCTAAGASFALTAGAFSNGEAP